MSLTTTQMQYINRMRELSFSIGRAEALNVPAPTGSEQMLEVLWNALATSLVEDALLVTVFGDEPEPEHIDLIAQVGTQLLDSTADGRRSVLAELIA